MSKKKKFIPEVNQEVECFCCDSNRGTPWLYPFSGYVKHVYDNSAMVTIIAGTSQMFSLDYYYSFLSNEKQEESD